MQNKRRTGFISILIIILCLSVCIGATYAYFTDSVKSEGNIIKSGKLDVTMEWANGTTDPANTSWTDASKGAIFNYQLWEPGYTEVRHIRIKNVGTLAFQYKLVIVANGEVTDLADVIDVYYFDPAEQVADRTDLTDNDKLGTLTQALAGMDQTANGTLLADEFVTVTIALKMQEDAGNNYQELSIGSDFSIQLHATQYTYESDAFDNQYDCLHAETEVILGYPATYEETGLTDGKKCTVCGSITEKQEEIPMLNDLAFTLVESAGGNYYTVKGTTTTGSSVVIPATYKGLPVTAIADNAFAWNDTISQIAIPEGVTTIGESAFNFCQSLTSVTIPDSVTTIGDCAFAECCNLTSVTIGNGVTTIGVQAFSWTGLTSVTIPDSVTSIGKEAFWVCNITSVTIPDSVITIGERAFSQCSYLTSVTIGSSVTSIGTGAFSEFSKITSFVVDDKNTAYKAIDGNLYSKDGTILLAYATGKNDTSFVIPNTVTTIDGYVFADCHSLTSIIIPNSVTTIGNSAFENCTGLTSVTIPDSVTTIGDQAFSWCRNLVSFTFEGTTQQWNDIEFGWNWNNYLGAREVVCSGGGTVALN